MPFRFAINGLGRIGRALLRIAAQRPELELVAINDVASPESLASLVARDSLHGAYSGTVALSQGNLLLDGRSIRCSRESEPAHVPWEGSGAQAVVDATGKCLTRECAGDHQRGEVERVIVSANAAGMDLTVCMGVNHADYDAASHHLLSGASCTTNCLVPIAHLLQREYGIRHGMLNTVHSYNNDQSLLESAHHDPRRARAAALNMIPTTTSAIQATIRVLPELDGRIEGFAIRVPTPNVSLIDFVVELEATPTLDEIADLFRGAAAGELRGILATTEEELVSSDFLGDPHSAIVDLPLLSSVGSGLYRIVAWYDNEWGHASRLADILELVGGTPA